MRLRKPPSTAAAPAPGWYDDPTAAGWLRYWDGAGWTTKTTPDLGEDPGPARRRAAQSRPTYDVAGTAAPRRAANRAAAPMLVESEDADSLDALFAGAATPDPTLDTVAGRALLAAAGHLTTGPPRQNSRNYPVSPRSFVLVVLAVALVAASGLALVKSGHLHLSLHRGGQKPVADVSAPTASPTASPSPTVSPSSTPTIVAGQPVTIRSSDCDATNVDVVSASGIQLSEQRSTGTYQSPAGWQVVVPAGWTAQTATADATASDGELAVFSTTAEPGVGMSLTVTPTSAGDATTGTSTALPPAASPQTAGCQMLSYLDASKISAQPLPPPTVGYWLVGHHGQQAAVAFTLHTTAGDASILEIGPTAELDRHGSTAPALAVLGSLANVS